MTSSLLSFPSLPFPSLPFPSDSPGLRLSLTQLLVASNCKSLIRKLLVKDENRRLGSRAGASDVKGHPFFRTTQWALLRHMKPPMTPNAGREVDAVNFRVVKESESVDIGAARVPSVMRLALETPGEHEVDPFEEFNSGEPPNLLSYCYYC